MVRLKGSKMQEIELKFLVPEYKVDSLMRQAKIKSSTTTQLAAHYYDTADNTLAQSGVALRIRKEGDSWVQTLKSNGDGMASRGEQNTVLEESTVAEALEADALYPDLSVYEDLEVDVKKLILGANAKQQDPSDRLNRLYITDVERTTRLIKGSNGVVEMAYDEGEVIHGEDPETTKPILELELELIEGDVEFLFEVAKTWCKRYNLSLSTVTKAERGGLMLQGKEFADATKSDLKQLAVDKKMKQPEFVRAVIHNCMIQILPNASAIAAGSTDGNHVHQLRVGIRRLRTVLKFFDKFSSQINPEWAPILKQTFGLLGEYRDREILEVKTQPMLEALGGPHVDWSEERESIKVSPIDAIRAPDFQITLLELIEYIMSPADADSPKRKGLAKDETSKILASLYKKISKASDQFASLNIDAQHDVRKRLKHLRYITEFVKPLYKKKKVKAFLKYLEPAQEVLGDYNDDLVGQEFYQEKTDNDANAWFAVGYFSAQKDHAAKQCAESLKSIKKAPVFW